MAGSMTRQSTNHDSIDRCSCPADHPYLPLGRSRCQDNTSGISDAGLDTVGYEHRSLSQMWRQHSCTRSLFKKWRQAFCKNPCRAWDVSSVMSQAKRDRGRAYSLVAQR
nr:hypothetical protein CFP56_74589 [Quercus suber]